MKSHFKKTALPFLGAATPELDGLNANAAIFAAPHGMPYPGIDNRVHAASALAIRKAMKEDAAWAEHWDWDVDSPVFADTGFQLADLGDLKTRPNGGRKVGLQNHALIAQTTRSILAAGAVPLMIGGDDSVPIPFLSAFDAQAPITVLQIDAHIDWRDERLGESLGFSSTMRRASEMKHVERIVQVGARGIGSARRAEVDMARSWGANLFPARHIHHHGFGEALEAIPDGARVVIALDLDAIDGATMPAVAYASPGGLSYLQVIELIAAVANKGKIAGFDMVEFVPKRDRNGYSAFVAGRILWNVVAQLAMRERAI